MSERSLEPSDGRNEPAGDELASWMDAWQDPDPAAERAAGEELAARVERVKRGSRRFGFGLVALTAGELIFSLGCVVFLSYWTLARPDVWRWLLLLLGLVLVGVAQVFTLQNRRGTYRPKNQTTQAFVELEWLRAQRQLRTIRFSLRFFLLEIAAIAALRLAELASKAAPAARLVELGLSLSGLTLLMLAVLIPALWLWHRKVRRKLEELEPLRAAFARDSAPS